MNEYSDIINLDRPKSKYPKMSMDKRGAIFSPYEALNGYEEKIIESSKYKEEKIELSDEDKEIINSILNKLEKNALVKIEYYDIKENKYKTVISNISKINTIKKTIVLKNNLTINFNDLHRIDIISN